MFAALMLAAGRSTRMGRDKALLPWVEDSLLLDWMVTALQNAGCECWVVAGPHNIAALKPHLPSGGRLILNPQPERGKTSSIACGLRALPSTAKALLLTAIDQPRPPRLYQSLTSCFAALPSTAILQPACDDHRDHPILFGSAHFNALPALEESTAGLRGYLAVRSTDRVTHPWPKEQLGFDLNDPARYQAALARFAAGWS